MTLNWITVFEPIDNENMQEVHYEPEKQLRKMGRKIRFCRGCKRWVLTHDYYNYCLDGYHEYSTAVETPVKLENGSQAKLKVVEG